MAIALDASSKFGTLNQTYSSPQTWNHTCTGSNLLLLVGISFHTQNGTFAFSGVTYNGVSMTKLAGTTSSDNVNDEFYIYGLLNPATGSNTISVSWTGGSTYWDGAAGSYTGVKQSGLPDATHTIGDAGTSATSAISTLTTIADNCWVVFAGFNAGGTPTAGTNLTIRKTFKSDGTSDYAHFGDSNGAVTPAGSYSQTVNFPSTLQYEMCQVSFAPVIASNRILGSLAMMGIGS